MRLDPRFLHSKVARRVFTLFIIAALIPTLTFAFIAFRQVTVQLNAQVDRQAHVESKLLGMAIIERLNSADRALQAIAAELADPIAAGKTIDLSERRKQSGGPFSDLLVVDELEQEPLLAVNDGMPDANRAGAIEHLKKGNAILRTAAGQGTDRRILLLRLVRRESSNLGLLVAEIDKQVLFDFSSVGEHGICLLGAAGLVLTCNDNVDGGLHAHLPAIYRDTNAGTVTWAGGEETYRADYWKIFLKGMYYSGPWTVVLSEANSSIAAPIAEFKSLFPTVIALSLLTVTWLSITQIRRSLVPLEKLREAANRIAMKDFKGSIVAIASQDEFEELAVAFNGMAKRLQKQFGTLSAMAEIDRTILSTLDADQVVDLLVARIQDVVPADATGIVMLDAADLDRSRLCWRARDNDSVTETLAVLPRDLAAIVGPYDLSVPYLTMGTPSYLAPLRRAGYTQFHIVPIHMQEQLAALIVLANREPARLEEDDLDRARELADRAAVALTKAAWQEQLYHQAHYDPLTDLPNRALLRDRLAQALVRAESQGTQVGVLFIDLDRFKNVNDSMGHTAGDTLLVQVAGALREAVAAGDTVVRLGGDEFMIIVPDIDSGAAMETLMTQYAGQVFQAVAHPFAVGDQHITVAASVGIAVYPRDGLTIDELMRNADSAMYHAKQHGGNNYQFYSRNLNAKALQRLTLESKLRRALERGEFELFYQPQVSTYSGNLIGAEALLRWRDPEAGLISPAEFIPLAEETGLIVPIGEWVVRTACAQSSRWNAIAPTALRVAVNISARQFRDPALIPTVADALAAHGLEPRLLELEVTESVAMNDINQAIATLRDLKALGVVLSLDDFGTGYSSLSYLHQVPVHALKIDQSFIRRLPHSLESIATVKAIIALAHGLDLSLIAEGVETIAQLEFLKQHECEEVQGYLISKPLPAQEFTARFLMQQSAADHRAAGASSR